MLESLEPQSVGGKVKIMNSYSFRVKMTIIAGNGAKKPVVIDIYILYQHTKGL